MEEDMSMMMMMMMMVRGTPEIPINESSTTLLPAWKLYQNPFYNSQDHSFKHLHNNLYLPVSARRLAASFCDLTFIMDSELHAARAQIMELEAELEFERMARKKVETMNKRLAKVLGEERKARAALEQVCEELAIEISEHKAEMNVMKRDIEDERRMLRVAEVLREERVQMKLSEAKLLFQEKLLELQVTKTDTLAPENPHIKQGIKGFVEFPRVVRAIGLKTRHMGTKLECQRAQLRILLNQKSPVRTNNLIMS